MDRFLEQLYDIIAFENTFTNIKFNQLIRQTNEVLSIDGSTHYLDESTGQIYTWNKHIWIINEPYDNSYLTRYIRFNRKMSYTKINITNSLRL